MASLLSLQEIRSEVLSEARRPGDTAFQALVDSWTNRIFRRYVKKYNFVEFHDRWYSTLSTTAPTPNTQAPYELTDVPRDMIELLEAHILVVTESTNQPKSPLAIIPSGEFHRKYGKTNPPTSGRPGEVCLRRKEGVRQHGFTSAAGATGIRVISTTSESNPSTPPGLLATALWYADAARTSVRRSSTSTQITATATSLSSALHYGIKTISINEAPAGRLTFDNTAGSIIYGEMLPWERSMGYNVLAFNLLPDIATYQFHCLYKRAPEYMSHASDTMAPLPEIAQDVVMLRVKARALKYNEDGDWKNLQMEADQLEREIANEYDHDAEDDSRMELD